MSQAPLSVDLGVEQEVDLSRWARAVLKRWWIVAGGLVVGSVLGLAIGARVEYRGSVLLEPAQAFGPTGETILNYESSASALAHIVTSGAALVNAANAAGVSEDELRGHVSIQSVSTGASASVAARGATLFEIDVLLPQRDRAAAAANALGAFVIKQTTSPYIDRSIEIDKAKIRDLKIQMSGVRERLRSFNKLLVSKQVQPFDRLLLVGQSSDAQQQLGSLSDDLSLAQNQLSLTEGVSVARLIGGRANVVQSAARTRSTSILVGSLIGLLTSVAGAVFVEKRRAVRLEDEIA